MEPEVLLTGATGLIGGELLRALSRRGVRVWALVRCARAERPADRLVRRLARSGPGLACELQGINPVRGDITARHCGLTREQRATLRKRVNVIIHCAGETSFLRDGACRVVNITGTGNVLGLARACYRHPLIVYVSTAAVSGVVQHACLHEDSVALASARHFNEYSRTKADAEKLVRTSGLPWLVIRPSIVLSAGLPDRQFARAVLWCVPLLAMLPVVPVDPTARLDIVPVGFVAESIVALLEEPPSDGGCYHVSAGGAGAATCRDLARVAEKVCSPRREVELVAPGLWRAEHERICSAISGARRVLRRVRPYLPFINADVVYDNQRLRTRLGASFPRLMHPLEYVGDLLRLVSAEEALLESANP